MYENCHTKYVMASFSFFVMTPKQIRWEDVPTESRQRIALVDANTMRSCERKLL